MNKTGIVRKIDELGRIVLPKELRKTLNINSGDDFQIIIENNNIVLEKYSKFENYEDKIKKIINCFKSVLNYHILISINNYIINNNEKINKDVIDIIQERKIYISQLIKKNIISENIIIEGKMIVMPIVLDSDLLGAIIIIGNDNINKMIEITKILNNLLKTMVY